MGFSRGDPELDRELQSEIKQRTRWRRDVLVLLAAFLILVAIALLAGLLGAPPASAWASY